MLFLNAKRLRDYPRLMLIAAWLVIGINLLFHQGWIGAFGQVIGGDFIMFYSTGQIYRSEPGLIFDYDTQINTQQKLVRPTILPGYNPYMNPPYVAPFYSLWTFLSLHSAFILWTISALSSVFLTAFMLLKLVHVKGKTSELSYTQLVIIILSFFPFIEGLLAGQNHWITLLLVTGIVFSMIKEKPYAAGIFAGLLVYKPQFVLGFIIIWLVWKKFKSLFSFCLVALSWGGLFLLANGFGLFHIYMQQSQVFMGLPYIEGFPNYLLVTFYGLLTSIFPQNIQSVLFTLSNLLFILGAAGLVWLAYALRNHNVRTQVPAIVAALLLPLLATPYALLHDMVILIPAFVLWTIYNNSSEFIKLSFVTYLGAFLLTFIGALTKIAWISLLIMGICAAMISWSLSNRKHLPEGNQLHG
jgi:alpha-1,2-mannosyltransferase